MNGKNNSPGSNANMEQNHCDASFPEDEPAAQNTRVNINVRSYRKLKHDPDGISVKAALDGIVARGILPDDSTKQVKKVTFESFTGCKEEETVIEIYEPASKKTRTQD